tara:strand:+ start:429 stop:671 length:243 start_codon:yes stop_codon:yes gene_type:complete
VLGTVIMILEIEQYDLNDALFDTSINGGYVKFYNQIKEALDQYDEKRIESLKGTLKFDDPNLDVESLDKMEIIYRYSCLP